MTEARSTGLDLEGGERVVREWTVEPVRPDLSTDRAGRFILTSRRCLFFPKPGFLQANRGAPSPTFAWRLEDTHAITAQRYSMMIGYGDRLEIPGFSIDGQGFRLNRETPSQPVLAEILKARDDRRKALGLPLP
jgi:hypothetical protein